jgi:rubredoxin---NAD+ reductase
MDPIVVVGSGLAGYNTVRELRRRDKRSALVMVTADGGEYYSKPSLSNAFAERRSPADLVLDTPARMSASTGARILTRTRVERIDVPQRRIRWDGGELAYSKLVLALGATAMRPRLAGDAAAELLSVNSLADYTVLRARLEGAGRVVVLGAGLIGCEFANDLAAAGLAVEVVEMAAQPLPRLLPADAASLLARRLAAIGVIWHFGAAAARLDHAGNAYRVTLDNGRILEADVVLGAIGLAPNVALAREAGIRVARGIVVGRHLETSAPHVFALGDCAEVEGHVLPFIEPISHAARALGATLAGKPTPVRYPAMPVRVKTPACPTIVAPALPGTAGGWRCSPCEDGMRSDFRDAKGALLGFALNGAAVGEMPVLSRELPALLA